MCFVNCYLSTSLSCFLSYKTRLGIKVSFLNWEKPRRRRQIRIYPILSYPILSILLQTSESAGSMYCCHCWLVSTLCDPRDCSTPGLSVFRHLQSLLKLMSIESVIPCNHLVLCHPLLQRFPASFPVSWLFASGGQIIGAPVLPMYYFGINLSKSTGENLSLVSCSGGSFSESAKFQQHSLQLTLSS